MCLFGPRRCVPSACPARPRHRRGLHVAQGCGGWPRVGKSSPGPGRQSSTSLVGCHATAGRCVRARTAHSIDGWVPEAQPGRANQNNGTAARIRRQTNRGTWQDPVHFPRWSDIFRTIRCILHAALPSRSPGCLANTEPGSPSSPKLCLAFATGSQLQVSHRKAQALKRIARLFRRHGRERLVGVQNPHERAYVFALGLPLADQFGRIVVELLVFTIHLVEQSKLPHQLAGLLSLLGLHVLLLQGSHRMMRHRFAVKTSMIPSQEAMLSVTNFQTPEVELLKLVAGILAPLLLHLVFSKLFGVFFFDFQSRPLVRFHCFVLTLLLQHQLWKTAFVRVAQEYRRRRRVRHHDDSYAISRV
ncbi:uncharacterized protein BJ171DRAFT_255014 [Polychytrium aggregatum]|uniref:uncharacterized protein n=1 Tax=Polychytrium aggregatum TaxID=110093 RepID=UPI0022FEB23B|nr:uncharacterized protein BJ171DRAFT_255014 [Polychytrium aggregatum]KAI9207774.1 hypothetical protein BJ171DRAFT_255014 [Polychytrium aggregatum]